jgi:hypothetical protein
MKLNGKIPKELYDAERKLQEAVDATDAFVREHEDVFEQFQELVNTRNDLIEECKSMCKKHKCTTDLFKAVRKELVTYDPASFKKVFGNKKFMDVCEVSSKKVRSLLDSLIISKSQLQEVDSNKKTSVSVTPAHKVWNFD